MAPIDEIPGSLTGKQVGNYSAARLLGKGSMGEVYEGTHPILDKKVAIKILSPELSQYPELVSRFRREARAIARIKHKAIVEAFDFGNLDDGRCYYVMEFLKGTNLATYMQAKGALPLEECVEIALPLMEGLAAAHDAGFIHRDIKPDNIFLIKTEEGKLFPKVVDFGIAKLRDPDEQGDSVVTRIDAVMGTPLYMSPEQAPGSTEDVGAWSDIYSTAATLYHVMCGKPPFYSDNPLELMLMHSWSPPPALNEVEEAIPQAISDVIMKALAKKPEDRFQTMLSFAEALRAASEGKPMTEKAPAAFEDTVLEGIPLTDVSGVEKDGKSTPPTVPPPSGAPIKKRTKTAETPVGETLSETKTPVAIEESDAPADDEPSKAAAKDEPPALEDDVSGGSVTTSLSGVASEKVIEASPPDATLFRRRKSRWPWAVGAGAVVGAAVLAFVLLRGSGGAANPAPHWTGVSSISRHTCAIQKRDGSVWCWGRNNYGQLGNGDLRPRTRPARVQGLKGARQVVAGGRHACALLANGSVRCWGKNAHGQLGDGSKAKRAAPVTVAKLGTATAITAGADHSCALLEDGKVRCWGRNDHGQLGIGKASAPVLVPTALRDLNAVIAVAAGGYHCCALTANGSAWCWGKNDVGQLGDGSKTAKGQPVKVNGLKDMLQLSAAGAHTCALRKGGTVWCWGDNASGQLGNGTTTASTTPVKAAGLTGAIQVSAGGGYLGGHSCAIAGNNTLWCWGNNAHGQLGRNPAEARQKRPVLVVDGKDYVSIASGGLHTCGIRRGGKLMCFGRNDDGQLGVGDKGDRTKPTPVK